MKHCCTKDVRDGFAQLRAAGVPGTYASQIAMTEFEDGYRGENYYVAVLLDGNVKHSHSSDDMQKIVASIIAQHKGAQS